MQHRPFNYKKIVPSKIDILSPLKCGKNKYRSAIVYNGESDLTIQTPKCHFKEGTLYVDSKKKEFLIFLEELLNTVLNTVHSKSVFFFNGKEFDKETIGKSLTQFYKVNDGKIEIFGVTMDVVPGYDTFKAILKIDEILFDRDIISIKANILATQEVKKEDLDDCVFEN